MVIDVARALGVSHGSVYRHFPSKAALRDAVVELARPRLDAARSHRRREGPAAPRLRRWLDALIGAKRQKVQGDPELFATYVARSLPDRATWLRAMSICSCAVLRASSRTALQQGEFAVADPTEAARAVIDATGRFHNPAHAAEWADPGITTAFERVWALSLRAD